MKAARKNGKKKLESSFRSTVYVDLSDCSNTADTSQMDMEQLEKEDEPFISSSSFNLPDEEEMAEEGQQHQLRICQLTEQLHRLQDAVESSIQEGIQTPRSLRSCPLPNVTGRVNWYVRQNVFLEAELELLRRPEKEKFEQHGRLTTQLKELEEALEMKN